MKCVMGMMCLIFGLSLISGTSTIDIDSINMIFGIIFILLAYLIIDEKED